MDTEFFSPDRLGGLRYVVAPAIHHRHSAPA